MSKLQSLRDAKTLDDLARLLGFTPSGLSYVLYKVPSGAKYKSFEVPKRSGGKRQIKAPQQVLALLQRRLADLLYDCLDELKNAVPARRSLAHGFEKKRNIITNASLHKRRRYVLNLDLEDFFPSINFGRVRGFFLKDKHFALHTKAATIIAQIACDENELPQGSPCSPVISNLVGHLLDARLARLAKTHKCTYSRYVDDITFSTSQKDFPPELAAPVSGSKSEWQLGAELRSKIQDSGFKINDNKTRMQFRDSRQVTTGLMVNEKVNIREEYWRTARHMCQALFTASAYYRMVPAPLTGGAAGDPPIRQDITSLNPIGGMLAHIHHVKNSADQRKSTLKKREPNAARQLYFRFLFFKNFVALNEPVVAPEGKTDSIYLRTAIRQLPTYHPRLGQIVNGKFESTIRFMNYSHTVHDVLQLGQGTGDLKFFISKYHKIVQGFGHAPLAHPVIVLFDNDDGGAELFGFAKANGAPNIAFSSGDPFYYLGLNLYLVKTPEKAAAPYKSCIEDLFDPTLLQTVLDGKTFDATKTHNAPGKYGKVVFAERVVVPNAATIDFSGFAALLDRIVAVLDDYTRLKALPFGQAV